MISPFYEYEVAHGAKMIDFHGWQLPLHYGSALAEHRAVRQGVGLFDVSHMGHVEIKGADATRFLDYLVTNEIASIPSGKAIYTLFCSEEGTCIEDALLFKRKTDHYSIIVNGVNRHKMKCHLEEHSTGWRVEVLPHYSGEAILALQGAHALESLSHYIPQAATLQPMAFMEIASASAPLIVARTGYTGELGFELIGPQEPVKELWHQLLAHPEVQLCGLAARDSLRLEAGYALYGHELSAQLYGCETVSSWTIRWDKPSFLGKEQLLRRRTSSCCRHPCAIKLCEEAIPRAGALLEREGTTLGQVTSGGFSPMLECGIAVGLASSKLERGTTLHLVQRGRRFLAQVSRLPFYSTHL